MKRILPIIITTIVICSFSCEKPMDYRNEWIGVYDFTSIYYLKSVAPHLCKETEYHHIGKIVIGNSDTTILVRHTENKTVELVVNNHGELYSYYGYSYNLRGSFIAETEVQFEYPISHSPSYAEGWRITGIKMKGIKNE